MFDVHFLNHFEYSGCRTLYQKVEKNKDKQFSYILFLKMKIVFVSIIASEQNL